MTTAANRRRAVHAARQPSIPPPARHRAMPARLLAMGFTAALALCVLCGCAARTDLPPLPRDMGSAMIRDVPFLVQEQYQCGPAALAMVLNHAGDHITPDEIARDVFRKDIRGAVNLDMILYPRHRGFNSMFGKGSPQAVINAVDQGRPMVVMVDHGLPMVRKLHYMVVIGYTPMEVIVHSGRERAKRIAWKEFLGQWQETGYWMLTVTPKEQ